MIWFYSLATLAAILVAIKLVGLICITWDYHTRKRK